MEHSPVLYTYLFFHIAGAHVLLPILVGTFIFVRITRLPTLLNMLLIWIWNGILSCLLLYANQYALPTPGRGICIAQASLIWAAAPMYSCSIFCLILHVWWGCRNSAKYGTCASYKVNSTLSAVLLLLPYVLFLGFGTLGAVVAMSDPAAVTLSRRVLYCAVGHGQYSTSTSATTAAFLLLASVVEELCSSSGNIGRPNVLDFNLRP